MKNGLWLYLVAAYSLTLPIPFFGERFQTSADLVAYLRIASLVAFALHAVSMYRTRRIDKATRLVLAIATGATWSCLLVMELYRLVTFIPFTFSFAISSLADTHRTLTQILGDFGSLYAVSGLVLMLGVTSVSAWWLLRFLERVAAASVRPSVVLACIAPLAFFAGHDARYVAEEVVLFKRAQFNERPLLVRDYSGLRTTSDESVFILQLESVNSAVLFERTGNGFRRRVPMPGLEAILREADGVVFPFFWANGMQTNRAHEAILCGISGNAGQALSVDPIRLQRHVCLPRHLADAGFATIFLYSYFDLDFFNFGKFQKRLGFSDLVYGDGLMAPGDPRHVWGFDDCAFYERAFDYLDKHGLARRQRVFAYFEVGTNHAPFGATAKHPQAHVYRSPGTLTEHYVNSLAEQDHCMKTFWARFKALGRDDIHLIIVPDHSVWMGGIIDPDAVFTTWLAYVPPIRRRGEFVPGAVLSPMPSQAQIYPTVLELLGAPARRDSFAFALRGEAAPVGYVDCHVLADPYARLLTVGGGRRAEYLLQTGSANIGSGPTEKMDYWTYQARYGCPP